MLGTMRFAVCACCGCVAVETAEQQGVTRGRGRHVRRGEFVLPAGWQELGADDDGNLASGRDVTRRVHLCPECASDGEDMEDRARAVARARSAPSPTERGHLAIAFAEAVRAPNLPPPPEGDGPTADQRLAIIAAMLARIDERVPDDSKAPQPYEVRDTELRDIVRLCTGGRPLTVAGRAAMAEVMG